MRNLLDRYLDADVFHNAIMTMYPEAPVECIPVLFSLLVIATTDIPTVLAQANSRVQGNNGMFVKIAPKEYCDLWLFITLLKANAEEERRGF